MSAYRYVVFPKGRQPTVDEVADLRAHAPGLGNHIAYGVCARDGALAIAFEAEPFDRMLAVNAEFEVLIRRWEVRGCAIVDRLSFVKDSTALRPVRTAPSQSAKALPTDAVASSDAVLTAKALAAKEAAARSRLEVVQSLWRYDAIARCGALAPYFLMAAGALAVIGTGFYASHRLQNSGRERRKETIERVHEDAMREPIDAAQ